MLSVEILTLSPSEPDISEVMRYAGVRGRDESAEKLLFECMKEAENAFVYKVCYKRIAKKDLNLHLDEIPCLNGCDEVVLFAATVGLGIDRLIKKYSSLSPSKALMFQALGSERIESLCDTFCKSFNSTRRFSPGYPGLPIEAQQDFFVLLEPYAHIGLTLNDSLLMSPTKSVTAVFGIKNGD